MKKFYTLLLLILMNLPLQTFSRDIEHPFLLCTRDQFPELRARAAKEPWKGMQERALAIAAGEMPEFERPRDMQKYTGAVALSYILEPEKQKAHALKIMTVILNGLVRVEFNPDKNWLGVVEPMGAAFACMLALDIVYDSLSPEELAACEEIIERQIKKIPRNGSWPAARYGTFGTWEIYHGIRTGPDDAYFERYVSQMTDDGVSTVSPAYAFARLGAGDDRPQKGAYADVLEFTGLDNRYYENEKLKLFYRFLFSAAVTPAKKYHLFGDVGPSWGRSVSSLLWRVGRFDEEAAGYAAWFLEEREPPGHVLPYLLMKEPLPEPVVPQSHLYFDGAAVFREPEDSPLSFGAMLYNITKNDEWHTHEEVNHIALSAYGERILVNGGWLGEITRPPWKNNTLSINGQRHQKKTGAGIAEGLMGEGFDYACGDSGKALGEDHFFRNLLLVHGHDGAPGYFVVLDEVDADPGEKIHHYLQTASEQEAREVSGGNYFTSVLDHHTDQEGLRMDVIYATRPVAVQQARVESGDHRRDAKSGWHYRLEAVFDTDAEGNRELLTVILPRQEGKPVLQNHVLLAEGKEGLQLTFPNGVRDTLLMGGPDQEVTTGKLRFRGRFLYMREKDGQPLAWFVREGQRLAFDDRVLLSEEESVSRFQRGEGMAVDARGRQGFR